MKKIFSFAMLACLAAAVCTGCKPTNAPDNGEKEYVFYADYQLTNKSDSTTWEAQKAAIEKALKAEGVTTDDAGFVLKGKDSAAVSIVLAEKMKRIESELQDAPVAVNTKIFVFGTEKQYFYADNDKEHPKCRWYCLEMGTPQNSHWDDTSDTVHGYATYRFCDSIWAFVNGIPEKITPPLDSWNFYLPYNLNETVGGAKIRLLFRYSSNTEWGTSDAKYTDVIAVYGGGEPKTLRVNGRNYYKLKDIPDLNKGAGGDYIWLYATKDYYDGYYLFGTYCKAAYSDCSWWQSSYDNFNPWKYATNSYTRGSHRCVERVVQRYTTSGVHQGNAEFNCCAGGNHIYLILSYATK